MFTNGKRNLCSRFANDAETIQSAFQDYYERTLLESSDCRHLPAQGDILDEDVYIEADADAEFSLTTPKVTPSWWRSIRKSPAFC